MFCKFYPSMLSAGCGVPRCRLLCLHGLMGSGHNWTTVASQLAATVPNASPNAANSGGGGSRTVGTPSSSEACGPSNERAQPSLPCASSLLCDVLTLDWPNHGRSDHTDAPHSLETMAAALDVLLQPAQAMQGLHSHLSNNVNPDGGWADVGRLEGGIYADLAVVPLGDLSRSTGPSTWFVPTRLADGKTPWTKDDPMAHTSAPTSSSRATNSRLDMTGASSSPSISSLSSHPLDASSSSFPRRVVSSSPTRGVPEPPAEPPRTVPMAHSMGGAAVMHFLLTRYAPGTRHIPLEKVIIVDIAPCQRPAYTQLLVDAVLALEALRIPTRSGGSHFLSDSHLSPTTTINASSIASENHTNTTDKLSVTTRAQAQETLLVNARRAGLRAFNGNAGLWLARYLLSNLQDGNGEQPQSRRGNGKEGDDEEKEEDTVENCRGDEITSRSGRDGSHKDVGGRGVASRPAAPPSGRLEWTSNTPAIIAGLAQGALQWPTRFEFGEEQPSPATTATTTAGYSSSPSSPSSPPPGQGPGDRASQLPPALHTPSPLLPSPLQPYRHGRTTPVHFIFGGTSPYWTDVPAATAIQYYFGANDGHDCAYDDTRGGGGTDDCTPRQSTTSHIHHIQQAGHFLFIEKPREFVALVRSILNLNS